MPKKQACFSGEHLDLKFFFTFLYFDKQEKQVNDCKYNNTVKG